MGAGTARMNDLTVTQTAQVCCHGQSLANKPSQLLAQSRTLSSVLATQGLAAHIRDEFPDADPSTLAVAVGYDHRAGNSVVSEQLGLLTAAVLLEAGYTVHLYDGMVATPLVVSAPNP